MILAYCLLLTFKGKWKWERGKGLSGSGVQGCEERKEELVLHNIHSKAQGYSHTYNIRSNI